MTRDEKLYMAKSIYEAFVEGYNSYATPANPYNTVGEAWEESSAKVLRDQLVKEANAVLEANAQKIDFTDLLDGASKKRRNKS